MTEETDKAVNRITATFVIMVVIVVAVLSGFGWVVSDVRDLTESNKNLAIANKNLLRENSNRINEIQTNRLAACIGTYEGIKQVFQPFFPPPPRSKIQQAQLDKFNKIVNRLKKGCKKKIQPKPIKKKVEKGQ